MGFELHCLRLEELSWLPIHFADHVTNELLIAWLLKKDLLLLPPSFHLFKDVNIVFSKDSALRSTLICDLDRSDQF